MMDFGAFWSGKNARGKGPRRGGSAAIGLALAASVAASPARAADDAMAPNDPLAGFNGDVAFIRSPNNEFVLLPNGRLQVDAYTFARPTDQMPEHTFLLRRARLELGGWVGPWFYFNLAGDFAIGAPAGPDPRPQSFLAATDDYVAVAPLRDRVILQAGQFDAPFTLENRTSDKYIDFMERSLTVRAFGEPNNKEIGVMLHGFPLLNRALYYSLGVFNGDGQNFRNVDTNFDFMGRAFVAPFAPTSVEALKNVHVGGSVWLGKRGETGNVLNAQTTQGGFQFFNPRWVGPDGKTPLELHQQGSIQAFALEVDFPVMHRFGFRFEYVHKSQNLVEADATGAAGGQILPLGNAKLDGWAAYGEAWVWIVGDDRIIGDPGLQLPTRLRKFEVTTPKHGLMLAARVDNVYETVKTDNPSLKNPNVGLTHVIAPELGINYWYSRRFRATFNYVSNVLEGNTANIAGAKTRNGGHPAEHEFLFRLGIAL